MPTDNTAEVQEPAIALLLDYSPLPVWIYDRQTLRFLAVNDAALQRYGYTREEFLALDLLAIRPPEDAPALLDHLRALKPDFPIPHGVWRHRAKGGTVFEANITSHRLIYHGRDAAIVTAQDISEQVQANRELRESEERHRNLFETMAQGVVYQAASGEIVSANGAAERILGLSLAQMQGRTSVDPRWRSLREDGSDFPGEMHPAMVALRTGQPVRDVVMGVYHPLEDAYRWININAVPQFRSGETQPYQVYATFEDITLRKEFAAMLERRVQERTAQLLHASRIKDEFLANMSHELRTPLQAILGFAELLTSEVYAPVNAAQRKALESITASGEHLLQLINDVLDLSKIEAGMTELKLELIDVDSLCRSCLALVKEGARTRGVALSLTVDFDLQLVADPRRLKQILVNLLDNAVKFTPAGGKVNLRAAREGQGTVRFTVEDTGIGIAPEQVERIFAPFVQAAGGLARPHEGAGLGLALVKRLVDLHGGTVSVESTTGAASTTGTGSRFHVTLPAAPAADREPDSAQPAVPAVPVTLADPVASATGAGGQPPAAGANGETAASILLAEDNATTAKIMTSYLEAQGYSVVLAHDGLEVLAMVERQPPDLILLDIQMPQLDGLETLHRLRSDPRFAHLPVIALTALAMAGDRERCLAAGATDYISKPVRLRDVTPIIQRHLRRGT